MFWIKIKLVIDDSDFTHIEVGGFDNVVRSIDNFSHFSIWTIHALWIYCKERGKCNMEILRVLSVDDQETLEYLKQFLSCFKYRKEFLPYFQVEISWTESPVCIRKINVDLSREFNALFPNR